MWVAACGKLHTKVVRQDRVILHELGKWELVGLPKTDLHPSPERHGGRNGICVPGPQGKEASACQRDRRQNRLCPHSLAEILGADSNPITNTTSAQGAGEVDEAATTEADGGRSGCDRSAAQGRLGRAGDCAGAWSVAQRDQRGARARPRHGRPLRRRAGAGRGGSAVGPVGTPGQAGAGQPPVWRGGEAPAPTVVAGTNRRETQAHGG